MSCSEIFRISALGVVDGTIKQVWNASRRGDEECLSASRVGGNWISEEAASKEQAVRNGVGISSATCECE